MCIFNDIFCCSLSCFLSPSLVLYSACSTKCIFHCSILVIFSDLTSKAGSRFSLIFFSSYCTEVAVVILVVVLKCIFARCKRHTFGKFAFLFFFSCMALHICYFKTTNSTVMSLFLSSGKSRQHKLISYSSIGFT